MFATGDRRAGDGTNGAADGEELAIAPTVTHTSALDQHHVDVAWVNLYLFTNIDLINDRKRFKLFFVFYFQI